MPGKSRVTLGDRENKTKKEWSTDRERQRFESNFPRTGTEHARGLQAEKTNQERLKTSQPLAPLYGEQRPVLKATFMRTESEPGR